jgi:hypothetical protein
VEGTPVATDRLDALLLVLLGFARHGVFLLPAW